MIIYVDIDNTICFTNGLNYNLSKPNYNNIKKVNELYNKGHTIVYWTARGTRTGLNHFKLTLEQINKWGCLYNELRMNKPVYDLFIDDKNLNALYHFTDENINTILN